MNKESHIGYKTSELGHMTAKAINILAEQSGVDCNLVKNSWLVGCLKHETQKGNILCQKDIEIIFHMPKSTATDTLQILEKAGLLQRVPLENDARRKQIVLTKKGTEFSEEMEKRIDMVEMAIRKGISEEEIKAFIGTLDKLRKNAAEFIEERKKEE